MAMAMDNPRQYLKYAVSVVDTQAHSLVPATQTMLTETLNRVCELLPSSSWCRRRDLTDHSQALNALLKNLATHACDLIE
jgi:hypothetical protein